MKQTHSDAAAYRKWLHEQVEESSYDSQSNVPHAQAQEEMADRRAALLKQLAGGEAKF